MLSYRGVYRVLAKARSKGSQPVPIRQVWTIVETVDPPIIKNLLNYGSLLLKRIGLDGDTEFNHAFADRYGRLLRKIGAFLQVSGLNVQGCMVARAALWHLLDAAGLHGKASVIREKFPFNTKHLKIVRIINILKKD